MTKKVRAYVVRVSPERSAAEIEARITELENKNNLSEHERLDLHILKHGEIRQHPKFSELGVTDFSRAWENLGKLRKRVTESFDSGFYIEAISLSLMQLDFLLRMYVVTTTGKVFKPEEKIMFGNLISRAEKAELKVDLVERLRSFNRIRIKAIHSYVLGDIEYSEIRQVYDSDPELVGDLVKAFYTRSPVIKEKYPEGNDA